MHMYVLIKRSNRPLSLGSALTMPAPKSFQQSRLRHKMPATAVAAKKVEPSVPTEAKAEAKVEPTEADIDRR